MSEMLIDQVRASTRDLHAEVELLTERLGALSSLPAFVVHLTVLAHHHRRLCERMGAAPHLQALVATRLTEVERDLQHLGSVSASERETTPEPLGPASCYGAAYVIEGSRLGAMVIAKRLRQVNMPVEGLCSVGGEPSAVRGRWQTFVEQLGHVPREKWPEVCHGAVEGFESLKAEYLRVLDAKRPA